MRLLVTGGCGFIGSNFIHYILQKYPTYKIVNFDKLTYAGNLENLKDIENNSNYKFVKEDICNISSLKFDNYKFDWIVNFAAESHVDRSIENADSFLMSNYLGVQKLLEFTRQNDIRIFQISSDEVYGDLEQEEATEEFPLNPSSPYSASKAAADLLIQAYHRTFGINYIISRSSNNFGPYQYPEKLIPLAITNLFIGKKIPIYGDGLQKRDWIYVTDNCKAIDLLLHKGELNQIYNIGTGFSRTNLELMRRLLIDLGIGEEKLEYVKDRLGHDRRYALNISKIQDLGFYISNSVFYKNLDNTISWYRKNEWFWRKLKCVV